MLAQRLGDAEVDDLHQRRAVLERHQHVRRLDVAVDDPFLMGMLDSLADVDEQLQSLFGGQLVLVAELGDGQALDQFHDEVRPAARRLPRVEDFGDVRVVHQGQGLPFRLETGADLSGVHARLEDFQGHLAANGIVLLSHEDDAETALANLLQKLELTNDAAGPLDDRHVGAGNHAGRRGLQEVAGTKMVLDHFLHALLELGVIGTGLLHEATALCLRADFHSGSENRFQRIGGLHGTDPRMVVYFQCVNGKQTGSTK